MKIMNILWVIMGCIFISQSSFAQTLTGKVMDLKNKKPITHASVILMDLNNEVVSKIPSNQQGIFKFDSYPNKHASFTIHVSSVGYQKQIIKVQMPIDTLIHISLSPEVQQLEEVTVRREKTTIEQLLDKKVINVGNDLLSGGGNALTILEQLPEIRTDESGNISLRGDKNVNVMVNGKPSPLSVAELLRQISASNINKIEIVTSPSAKYPANGLTGIINIVTDRKVVSGVTANNSTGANSLGGYNGETDVSIGWKKLVFSLGLGYEKNIFKNNSFQKRWGIAPYQVENDFNFNGNISKFRSGVDLFLNKSNEFSVKLNYVNNNHNMNTKGNIVQNGTIQPQDNRQYHLHKTLEFSTNYRRIFNKPENFLEVDIQVSNNENILKSRFLEKIGIDNNQADNNVNISRVSADYVSQLSKNLNLESGLLWVNQQLRSGFSSFDDMENVVKNNAFSYNENTYSSYLILKYNVSNFTVQSGLRSEFFYRNAQVSSASLNNKFNNLFPSVHIGYDVSKADKFTVGYSKRISRPSLEQLNPYVNQSNRFLIYIGSPDLRPEFSDNFELNFLRSKSKFTFGYSLSYRLKNGIILDKLSLSENGTNIMSPINGGSSRGIGADIFTTLEIFDWWKANLQANLNYEKAKQPEIYLYRKNEIGYGISLKNDLKFSDKTKLALSWRYDGAQKSYLSDYSENQGIEVAIRHSIFHNKANIGLRLADVFNTRVYSGKIYSTNFVQEFRYKPVSRVCYLTFTYNFVKGTKLNERSIKDREYNSGVID